MLTRADLAGIWQLHREIEDRHSGQQGIFRGTCTFREHGSSRLDYFEEGTIRFGSGPALTANRRYQWHFLVDRVDVRFEDGTAFHSFVPAGQAQGTEHPCGADHYLVQYDFRQWPIWQAVWDVTGPRKDYTSTSRYTRADAPERIL